MICAGLASTQCLAANDPIVKNGIVDLRSPGSLKSPVALRGEWKFYWNKLVMPGDSITTNDVLAIPRLWNKSTFRGQTLPAKGYATYQLTVLLPKDRPKLGLELPDVYCAYKLYINGVLSAQNGETGTSAANSKPFWVTQIIPLSPRYDTLHVLMQVSNFWHVNGGTYKDILIGNRDDITLKNYQERAVDLVLSGCLLMGGLFFLGLFIIGRHDKAAFFFSLFCLVYSYRIIGTDTYVLHSLFPYLNWFLTIKLEYASLTISVALFAHYITCLYPQDTQRIVINAVIWYCILYSVVIIVTPTEIFTRGLTPFLGVMFGYIGFAFYVSIRAARYRRVGAVFALISCGIMLLVFLITNLEYFGILIPPRVAIFFGYLLFFFFQSLVLARRFATALKQAAAKAQQALQVKSEFLSNMSHEIRTPLNVVIGMTHVLLENKPREDQQKNLDLLLFSANNLLSIVNDILDYSKLEAGKVVFEQQPMSLVSIGENIVAGLKGSAEEKGIALKLDTKELNTQLVQGDSTRTSQVIYNLVQNAIKFTEKGTVILSFKTIAATDTSATITISVADTGIGISPEKQQLIFERFTQADSSISRSYGGTGLGLAITKRILKLQDVELQLDSEPGKGSVFFFTQTFPLIPVSVTETPAANQAPAPIAPLQDVHILVVEDNPFNVMVVQSILEKNGAIIEVATNGEEALEKVIPGKYNMILMDLNMPVMDGFETTRQLRRRGEQLPIIALTANLPNEIEHDILQAGLSGLVVKPFNPEELVKEIRKHLS
ncbi:MAG: response regulator [Chitinophagaceae bacterium]